MGDLVLSLFPGIGLLDMAFEEEGFCVVRGPDLLWGGDVRRFHPPAGKFNGVIGGPPCQAFMPMRAYVQAHPTDGGTGYENLIPEFARCIAEADPEWFLMENVMGAPMPQVDTYRVVSCVLNNRWLGEDQNRRRRFSFGTRDGRGLAPHLELVALESPTFEPAVISRHSAKKPFNGIPARHWKEMARLQGLPSAFDLPAFYQDAKQKAIANGVPLPMGRAIARAVRSALAVAPAPPVSGVTP